MKKYSESKNPTQQTVKIIGGGEKKKKKKL